MKGKRWLKIGLLLALPIGLYLVAAERASWRPRTLTGNERSGFQFQSVKWSADGSTLAARGGQLNSTQHDEVQVWDVASRTLRCTLRTRIGRYWKPPITDIVLSPDGRWVFGDTSQYGLSSGIVMWDAQSGRQIRKLEGYYPLFSIAHDRQFASATIDSWRNFGARATDIKIWDAATGKLRRSIRVMPPRNRFYFGYNPSPAPAPMPEWEMTADGHLLAVALLKSDPARPDYVTDNGGVLLFDVFQNKVRAVLAPPTSRANTFTTTDNLAFAPNGRILAVCHCDHSDTDVVQLWHLPSSTAPQPRVIWTWKQEDILVQAFSPDSSLVVLSTWETQKIRLHETRNGKLLGMLGQASSLAFSPDSRMLALGYNKIIRLWNVRTTRIERELKGHRGSISDLQFSPDGRTLASAGLDGTVKLWRVR